MATEKLVLTIDGMTCMNCQNRIEQALKKTAGISSVRVSYSRGLAEVEFDPEILTRSQIVTIIEDLDYTVTEEGQGRKQKQLRSVGTVAVIILLYYLLQHFGILNLLVPSMLADSKMSYGMLFLVGLLTSVHCITMCGGINLSQCIPSGNPDEKSTSDVHVIMPSLFYNAGRVVSYSVIGFLLGGIGMLLTGGSGSGIPVLLQGILKIAAGLFMVLMGINMLGIFPAFRCFWIRFPKKSAAKISQKKRTEKRPFVVGLLNGLTPCGPLQSMQIIALGSGNPAAGALAMFMFSLGTVPLMLGLGSLVSALGKKYSRIVMQTGCILVVVLGLAMFSQGVALSGLMSGAGFLPGSQASSVSQISSRSQTSSGSQISSGSQASTEPQTSSGSQITSDGTEAESGTAAELNMAAIAESGDIQYVESNLDFGSYPEITVYSGIPVQWTIHVPENVINGCNYKMIMQTYGITHEFTPGDNVIEFTPGEPGTVQYTCWMGMIYGKINIIDGKGE